MIKKYIAYLKDNPQGYWFKARLYGWGWVPATWQGFVVLGIFILILLLNGFYFSSKTPVLFFGVLTVSVAILFWICYKKGEKPQWNWGDPRKK